jgi:hypothetical protein
MYSFALGTGSASQGTCKLGNSLNQTTPLISSTVYRVLVPATSSGGTDLNINLETLYKQ